MKNLILILALIIPFGIFAQTEIAPTTFSNKSSITASTFIGGNSGMTVDYRRTLKNHQQMVFGFSSTWDGVKATNIGFRRHYRTTKKLSTAIGFDALMVQTTSKEDNFFRRIKDLSPVFNRPKVMFAAGLYYDLGKNIELMTEVQLRSMLINYNTNTRSNLKVGLKYNF